MPVSDKQLELHASLKRFYNSGAEYFSEASQVNSVVTPERAKLLSWVKPGDRVLDVGCGPGDNRRHLADGVRYIGCDLSVVGLRLAIELLPDSSFTLGESQKLPFADDSFDVVLSTYALEHFVFARESLEEMWRVCRPGGLLLLISPAYDDPRCLPPSVSHCSPLERAWMMVQQTWRQTRRHVAPDQWDFACVSRPRILRDAYQSDFDAVHLVSAREISNFFKSKHGKIVFERKRSPRPVLESSWVRQIREHFRNLLLRVHIGEYAGLNLQIAVAKGMTAPERNCPE